MIDNDITFANIRALSGLGEELLLVGLNAINQLNVAEQIYFDVTSPVDSLDTFFVFQNNQQGKMLCKQFSTVLVDMKKEGLLAKILAGDG